MKKNHQQISFSCGQALTEVLVSLIFFAPVFLLVPIIGKYLDIKQKTIEASRYAVWERSVWSDPGSVWDSGENTKNDEEIGTEVDRRFFGHLSQLISDKSAFSHNGIVENPMWTTVDTAIDTGSNTTQNNNAPTSLELPILNGVKVGTKTLRSYAEITENKAPSSILDEPVNFIADEIVEIPIVDTELGMKILVNDYAIATISAPVKNYIDSNKDLIIQARSALLTNTWSAPDESRFHQRVDKLVADEIVDDTVKLARGVYVAGQFASLISDGDELYTDGKDLSAETSVDSTIFPQHALRKQAKPDEE